MKQSIYTAIKILSITLISSILALELWNITMSPDWSSYPASWSTARWIGRCIVAAHLIEGILAAIWVTRRNEPQALRYGIYTFFIGTVGLQELGDRDD